MTRQHSQRVGVLLVLATVTTSWLTSDVAVGEAARFVLFEVAYVILPGCCLYLVLDSSPRGRLRTLTIGWPLGYAIEVGAFALSAALGRRLAFDFLPLVGVVAIAVLLRTALGRLRLQALLPRPGDRVGKQTSHTTAAEWLFVGIVTSAALTLLALKAFTVSPLPGHFHSVAYGPEEIFPIALAAEARNHWPIMTPWVAGLPLRYYTAVFIHGAAINQVTGVGLPTVYFRLFPTTVTLLIALQLWSLGRALGRARFAGPLAITLFFLLRAITLSPTRTLPFEGNALEYYWGIPTMMFGGLFLLALFSVMQLWLVEDGVNPPPASDGQAKSPRWNEARALILMAVLIVGCASAKMFAAVDFVGGLWLFWLWSLVTRKAFRLLSCSALVAAVGVGAMYYLMLAGGLVKLMDYHLFNTSIVRSISSRAREPVEAVVGHTSLWILFVVCAAIVMAISLSAPVLGAIWLFLRRSPLSSFEIFCIAVLIAGSGCYYVTVGTTGGANIYFRFYGYLALMLVSAGGLADFWRDIPPTTQRSIAVTCGALLILGLVMAAGLGLTHRTTRWYLLAYVAIAVVALLMARRLGAHYSPTIQSHRGRVLACCIPLLGALSLIKPLALASVKAKDVIEDHRLAAVDSPTGYGMTAALYQGLSWVRTHTQACNVLAVNNYYGSADPNGTSAYLDYAAFTERRIFLESWSYTPNGLVSTNPFPRRMALNNDAVLRGDPLALRELGQQGVSYVLVDKTHGRGAHESASVSRLVFENRALDVYRLLADPSASHHGLGCVSRA